MKKVRVLLIMFVALLAIAGGDLYLSMRSAASSNVNIATTLTACTTAEVRTQILYDATRDDGLVRYDVVATNVSAKPCSVGGAPTLSYSDPSNTPLPSTISPQSSDAPSPVTLDPAQSVRATLTTYTNAMSAGVKDGSACTKDIAHIRLSMPDDKRYRLMPTPFAVSCAPTTLSVFSR